MLPNASANPRPAYLILAEELRPNPGQWQAYESKGNCVMLAGPGSGKTKTLTVKMARMLHEDVRPPRGVACLTYSTECARELKRRLGALGVGQSQRVFIGTVHGFCLNHLVRPFARLAGFDIPKPLTVPDDSTWERLFAQAATQVGIYENPQWIKSRFEKYRRTYLNRESREWRERDPETAKWIETFETLLHTSGFLDFDDMVLLGLRLIEQYEWVRRAIWAKYPILVVDEYQDLGLPLHRIVLNLCFKAGVRILAVGDPNQSIYSFTGAYPALLRELAEMSEIEQVLLKLNYRCGKTIVAGSKIALGEDPGYEAANEHLGTIDFWECPAGIEEQVQMICQTIIPQSLQREKKRQLGDIAVLYVDRYDAGRITAAAKRDGYKYIGGDKDARYKHTPLTEWLEDCAAWCAEGWRTRAPRLSNLIQFWLTIHSNARGREQISLRKQLVNFLWTHRDPSLMLHEWLVAIQNECLGRVFNNNKELNDEKAVFGNLLKAAADPNRLGDFTVGAFGGLRGSSDHLNLITLHSSKGREFDVVIIMGLDQGRIPSWRARTTESKREPRRLFYVGITRAKQEVHLVYSGWTEDKYGRRHNDGPSQFLIEVQQRLSGPQVL